eukprot:14044024-Heterocapsa_arctica.AAC.1
MPQVGEEPLEAPQSPKVPQDRGPATNHDRTLSQRCSPAPAAGKPALKHALAAQAGRASSPVAQAVHELPLQPNRVEGQTLAAYSFFPEQPGTRQPPSTPGRRDSRRSLLAEVDEVLTASLPSQELTTVLRKAA